MSDATMTPLTLRSNDRAYVKDKGPRSRRTRIEVGDAKDPSVFHPQFKTLHWDNECNFSVRLVDADAASATVAQTEKGIEWRRGDRTARFYETADPKHEHGGFEFEVELAARPVSNLIAFTITTKGFEFLYQPLELSAFERKRGCVRPDDVKGSYAVYHATRRHNYIGGKNYQTGKAFHIYRPWAQDANGARVWCDLAIDVDAGTMSITIPQDFLDAAAYPVLVDPTYGYTTHGSNEDNTGEYAIAYNAGSFGGTNNSTIASGVWYGRTNGTPGTATVDIGLYSDGASVPVTRLARISASVSIPGTASDVSVSQTDSFQLQNGTTYWLGASSTLGSGWCNEYDTGGPDDSFLSGISTLPATWTEEGSGGGFRYSFYFNLSGGGSNITVNPTGLGVTASLGTPTELRSGVKMAPTGFGPIASLGVPSLALSIMTMTPAGFGLTASLGTPAAAADIRITPGGFGVTMSLGAMAVEADLTLTGVVGYGLTTTLGAPSVVINNGTGSDNTLTPAGFGLVAAIGTPARQLSSVFTPAGLGLVTSLGNANLPGANPFITPAGFGLHAMVTGPTILGPVAKGGGHIVHRRRRR